jgi:hypothetical protein
MSRKQICGRNVHDPALVACSAGSEERGGPIDGCYFCAVNKPDQWICYDFGTLSVKPTEYFLKMAVKCGNARE